jgi:hypothetical protein
MMAALTVREAWLMLTDQQLTQQDVQRLDSVCLCTAPGAEPDYGPPVLTTLDSYLDNWTGLDPIAFGPAMARYHCRVCAAEIAYHAGGWYHLDEQDPAAFHQAVVGYGVQS